MAKVKAAVARLLRWRDRTRLTPDEVAYMAQSSGARAMVCQAAFPAHAARARELSPALHDLSGFPPAVVCWGAVETAQFKQQSRDFAVRLGRAELAMIPIENSVAGRVADIHHFLPGSGLHIIGEYFLPIRFQLLALPEASLATIKSVHSHIHALGQCRKVIRELGVVEPKERVVATVAA